MDKREKASTLLEKGEVEKHNSNYEDALSLYEQALHLDPTNIWVYYNPAKVQFILNLYE